MFVDQSILRSALEEMFEGRGVEISRTAHIPINAFDLKQLVTIHDHEEAFIRRTFEQSVDQAYRARVAEGRGSAKVTSADVRTALMMLGAAIAAAPETEVSAENKAVASQICPYC